MRTTSSIPTGVNECSAISVDGKLPEYITRADYSLLVRQEGKPGLVARCPTTKTLSTYLATDTTGGGCEDFFVAFFSGFLPEFFGEKGQWT